MITIPNQKWRGNIEAFLDYTEKRIDRIKRQLPIIEGLITQARAAAEHGHWLTLTDIVWEINGAIEGLSK